MDIGAYEFNIAPITASEEATVVSGVRDHVNPGCSSTTVVAA